MSAVSAVLAWLIRPLRVMLGGAGNNDPSWLQEASKVLLEEGLNSSTSDQGQLQKEQLNSRTAPPAAAGSSPSNASPHFTSSIGSKERPKERSRKRWNHPFFRMVNVCTLFAAVAVVGSNVYSVFFAPHEDLDRTVLHFYGMILALVAIATELELETWLSACRVLEGFIPRGVLYSLIGFLTITSLSDWSTDWAHNVVGMCFTCIGGFYMLMGLTCCEYYKRRSELAA